MLNDKMSVFAIKINILAIDTSIQLPNDLVKLIFFLTKNCFVWYSDKFVTKAIHL